MWGRGAAASAAARTPTGRGRLGPAPAGPAPAPPPPAVRALARQHGGGGGRPSAGSASAVSAAAARGVVGQRARGGARLPTEAHPQGVHVGPDPPEGELRAGRPGRARPSRRGSSGRGPRCCPRGRPGPAGVRRPEGGWAVGAALRAVGGRAGGRCGTRRWQAWRLGGPRGASGAAVPRARAPRVSQDPTGCDSADSPWGVLGVAFGAGCGTASFFTSARKGDGVRARGRSPSRRRGEAGGGGELRTPGAQLPRLQSAMSFWPKEKLQPLFSLGGSC